MARADCTAATAPAGALLLCQLCFLRWSVGYGLGFRGSSAELRVYWFELVFGGRNFGPLNPKLSGLAGVKAGHSQACNRTFQALLRLSTCYPSLAIALPDNTPHL